jgi:hypothetical protein
MHIFAVYLIHIYESIMKASSNWVFLEDPRPKTESENTGSPEIILLPETKERVDAEERSKIPHVLTVHSAGPDVTDKRIKKGSTVVLDIEHPFKVIKPSLTSDEVLIAVQSFQIMMVG